MRRRGRGTGVCRNCRSMEGFCIVLVFGSLFVLIHIAMKDSFWEPALQVPEPSGSQQMRMTLTSSITETETKENNIPDWDAEVIKEGNDFINIFAGGEDFVQFLEDVKQDELNDRFLNKHRYEFAMNNDPLCGGNVFLVTLIHSAPQNFEKRMKIRNTWGSVRSHMGTNIVSVFLTAQIGDRNESLQEQLRNESRVYKDMVQGNFIDSYVNLTYKHVMGLHWAKTFCNHAKFVLKTDDDNLVEMFHLIDFLLQRSPDGDINDFIYCSLYRNQSPIRDKRDKWYVDRASYPYDKYPPYCEGFAYVMSMDVALNFYAASEKVRFYWVDDVLVTGFLALKSGVLHRKLEPEHSYALMSDPDLKWKLPTLLFVLDKYQVGKTDWPSVWKDIRSLHGLQK